MAAPSWTPIWLAQADIENAISPDTVAACFDDGDGVVNATAIAAVITQAEMEVLSFLGEYGPPPFSSQTLATLSADNFLKSCAVEYAKAFTFDRHPEYVRANGKERGERFTRADLRMQRVLDSRQRPPQVAQKPANVGGIAYRGEHTIRLRRGERGGY